MRQGAGILLYRVVNREIEFFLVHPGGPFWKGKDNGVWSIPKGEFKDDEDPLSAAKREFYEETGFKVDGKFIQLTPVKQKAGKMVHAWAVEGNLDAQQIRSNTFPLQWPPKSGRWIQVPEVDKAEWFTSAEAKIKINKAQISFIEEVEAIPEAENRA